MGMFDYVKIEENKLGIPAGEYQTKELECELEVYLVNENLEIILIESSYKKDLPKKETFSKNIRLLHRDTIVNIYAKVENGVIIKLITEDEYNYL